MTNINEILGNQCVFRDTIPYTECLKCWGRNYRCEHYISHTGKSTRENRSFSFNKANCCNEYQDNFYIGHQTITTIIKPKFLERFYRSQR